MRNAAGMSKRDQRHEDDISDEELDELWDDVLVFQQTMIMEMLFLAATAVIVFGGAMLFYWSNSPT